MKGFQNFFGQFQFVVISILTTAIIVWLAASLQLVPPDPQSQVQSPQPSVLQTPKSSPGTSSSPAPPASPPLYESLPSLPRTPPSSPTSSAPSATKDYYGHLPYAENDGRRLVNVGEFVRGTYRRAEYLDQEAAAAFTQLVEAAANSNLTLQPISGFRSVKDQKELFDKQVKKQGSQAAAAKFSAPPGFSEHHTGYAIDISDRNQPEQDLKLTFEETAAYRWLTANAKSYGFELSFPPNNKQRVSFEPWHWRYIGTQRAAVQFASTR